MTYLTRMTINPARRGARQLLGSPQAMHAAVMGAFLTQPSPTREGRPLWRLDSDPDGHRPLLYLMSPERPDLTHIVEQAGWPALPDGWQTREYEPLLGRIAEGQTWAFRLTANPVRRIRRDGGTRGEVKGHVTAAQQQTWLIEQATRHGIEVAKNREGDPALIVTERRVLRFPRQGSTVTIATARFDGHLVVVDPAALRGALLSGIGRGKAYGCGLLTLANE